MRTFTFQASSIVRVMTTALMSLKKIFIILMRQLILWNDVLEKCLNKITVNSNDNSLDIELDLELVLKKGVTLHHIWKTPS